LSDFDLGIVVESISVQGGIDTPSPEGFKERRAEEGFW